MSELSAAGKYFLQGKILFTNSLLKISFKYSHVCPSPSFSLLTFQFVTHQHFAEPLTILLVHIFFQLCAFCDGVKDLTQVHSPMEFWGANCWKLFSADTSKAGIPENTITALEPSNNTLLKCVCVCVNKGCVS